MLHACVKRFDGTENLQNFFGFRGELKQGIVCFHSSHYCILYSSISADSLVMMKLYCCKILCIYRDQDIV